LLRLIAPRTPSKQENTSQITTRKVNVDAFEVVKPDQERTTAYLLADIVVEDVVDQTQPFEGNGRGQLQKFSAVHSPVLTLGS
jgi:hypothetical protein